MSSISSPAYTPTVLQKIVDIGVWNMNTTTTHAVAHGLTLSKIRGAAVMIITDGSTSAHMYTNTNNVGSGNHILSFTATNVSLTRETGGSFDSVSFDDAAFMRGYIVIDYVA